MNTEQALAELINKIERRFYGKYRGIVVDNADPLGLGRLKVNVPSVMGKDVVTGWAMPCTPYGGDVNQGMLFIPENGAGVWLEFEEGDIEFPIWVGSYWSQADTLETPTATDKDTAEETDAVAEPIASRKIIKTLKGHTIQFEDKDGEEMITIIQRVSDSQHNFITLNNSGISIKDFTENEIIMSDSEVRIAAKVAMTIDAEGQDFQLTASSVAINASSIDLNKT